MSLFKPRPRTARRVRTVDTPIPYALTADPDLIRFRPEERALRSRFKLMSEQAAAKVNEYKPTPEEKERTEQIKDTASRQKERWKEQLRAMNKQNREYWKRP